MPFGAKTVKDIVNDITSDPRLSSLDCSANASVKRNPKAFIDSIADPLKSHKEIKTLKMSDCSINDIACEGLAAILSANSSIEELILDKNEISAEGAVIIATALHSNSTLKHIDVKQQKQKPTEAFIGAFHVMLRDANSSLLKIIWDADYNKVAPINKLLQRNAAILKGTYTGPMPGAGEGYVAPPTPTASPDSSPPPAAAPAAAPAAEPPKKESPPAAAEEHKLMFPKGQGISNPTFQYFPFSGRGELTRLIAAAGGVELDEPALPEDRKELCASAGAIGTGVPVLEHNGIKMCQSQAIQGYISLISPKFEKLPAKARGIDLMWAAHMEDFIAEWFASGIPATLFGGQPATDEIKAKVKATMEKWFAHFEKLCPADGFVNKQDFPTAADCVAVYHFYSAAPHKALVNQSGFDPNAYPKFKALADRAAAAPGLKEYIVSSNSLTTNPFEMLC